MVENLKMRPHHIYCSQFSPWKFPERGEEFTRIADMIKITLGSGTHPPLEVTEGIDLLCKLCAFCKDNQCNSPRGGEDQVRKYDGIILSCLGIKYGDVLTVSKYQEIMRAKAPIPFCAKCANGVRCKIGPIFQ